MVPNHLKQNSIIKSFMTIIFLRNWTSFRFWRNCLYFLIEKFTQAAYQLLVCFPLFVLNWYPLVFLRVAICVFLFSDYVYFVSSGSCIKNRGNPSCHTGCSDYDAEEVQGDDFVLARLSGDPWNKCQHEAGRNIRGFQPFKLSYSPTNYWLLF